MSRVDPLAYAVILPTLYAAHTVADHVVQTDHQALNKTTSWPGMAGHVGTYQITQAASVAAVLAATGVRTSPLGLLAGAALSAATHALIDRRWPVQWILRVTRSPGFARTNVQPEFRADLMEVEHQLCGPRLHAVIPARPTPLHGPYIADQALHTGVLAIAAALMAWRRS